MNLAKIELNKLHNTIAIMGNDLAAMKKAYAAKEKEIVELRRKLGLN